MLAAASVADAATPLEGRWLLDGKVAVQVYDCGPDLCGRIAWLKFTRPPGQRFDHDKLNPHPELRARLLCGLTVLWGLKPAGAGRWTGGAFYNPRDGRTYGVNVRMETANELQARLYLGAPIFGKNEPLVRFRGQKHC